MTRCLFILAVVAALIVAPSAFGHGTDAGLLQPKRACNWEHRGEERTVLDGQRKVWIFWRCVCPYAEPPHGCHWQHIWTREVFNHAARRGHYHGNYVGMDLVGLRIHAFRKLELHDGAPVWHTYLPPQNVWCRAGRH